MAVEQRPKFCAPWRLLASYEARLISNAGAAQVARRASPALCENATRKMLVGETNGNIGDIQSVLW
jgi:hypothetical protein